MRVIEMKYRYVVPVLIGFALINGKIDYLQFLHYHLHLNI